MKAFPLFVLMMLHVVFPFVGAQHYYWGFSSMFSDWDISSIHRNNMTLTVFLPRTLFPSDVSGMSVSQYQEHPTLPFNPFALQVALNNVWKVTSNNSHVIVTMHLSVTIQPDVSHYVRNMYYTFQANGGFWADALQAFYCTVYVVFSHSSWDENMEFQAVQVYASGKHITEADVATLPVLSMPNSTFWNAGSTGIPVSIFSGHAVATTIGYSYILILWPNFTIAARDASYIDYFCSSGALDVMDPGRASAKDVYGPYQITVGYQPMDVTVRTPCGSFSIDSGFGSETYAARITFDTDTTQQNHSYRQLVSINCESVDERTPLRGTPCFGCAYTEQWRSWVIVGLVFYIFVIVSVGALVFLAQQSAHNRPVAKTCIEVLSIVAAGYSIALVVRSIYVISQPMQPCFNTDYELKSLCVFPVKESQYISTIMPSIYVCGYGFGALNILFFGVVEIGAIVSLWSAKKNEAKPEELVAAETTFEKIASFCWDVLWPLSMSVGLTMLDHIPISDTCIILDGLANALNVCLLGFIPVGVGLVFSLLACCCSWAQISKWKGFKLGMICAGFPLYVVLVFVPILKSFQWPKFVLNANSGAGLILVNVLIALALKSIQGSGTVYAVTSAVASQCTSSALKYMDKENTVSDRTVGQSKVRPPTQPPMFRRRSSSR